MTTIITRLYKDEQTANAAVSDLRENNFPDDTHDVFSGSGTSADEIEAAGVDREKAEVYASKLGDGNSLLVVRAPFVPFGAASTAIRTVDSHPVVASGVENENQLVSYEMAEPSVGSVLRNHPLMLTRRKNVGGGGTLSESLGMRMLSSPWPRTSAVGESGHWSTAVAPIPLIKSGARKLSVFTENRYFGAFLFPLLWRRERSKSVIPGGGFPFSRLFGLPLLIRK